VGKRRSGAGIDSDDKVEDSSRERVGKIIK